jgi:hypothetical protein
VLSSVEYDDGTRGASDHVDPESGERIENVPFLYARNLGRSTFL